MPSRSGPLKHEIDRTEPLDPEELSGLLRTADMVRRRLGNVVDGAHVTLQQYSVLHILQRCGERGLPTLEVAGRVIEQAPGITRLIDRLVAKGLVKRERSPKDRRVVHCHLTAVGRRLADTLDESVRQATSRLLSGLNSTERAELVRLLETIRAQAGASAGAPDRSNSRP